MVPKIHIFCALGLILFLLCSGCTSTVETPQPTNTVTTVTTGGHTQTSTIPPQTIKQTITPDMLLSYMPVAPSGWTMSTTFAGEVKALPGVIGAERTYNNPSKSNSFVKITILCFPNVISADLPSEPGCHIISLGGNQALECPIEGSPRGLLYIKNRCSVASVSGNVLIAEYNSLMQGINFQGLHSLF
ncbi:MAG: hypothetical protein LUP99_05740 [Methanomicrobiales archaeon]|nr:hypothetical protein [Methanomicrobiales archaeon]